MSLGTSRDTIRERTRRRRPPVRGLVLGLGILLVLALSAAQQAARTLVPETRAGTAAATRAAPASAAAAAPRATRPTPAIAVAPAIAAAPAPPTTSPAVAAPSAPAGAAVPDDAVFRALTAELERARSSLKIEDNPAPYFISASVSDIDTAEVQAVFGAVTDSSQQHERTLDVSVRVGERSLDSSRFARRDPPFRFGGADLPEEDNEIELRRALWLVLDQAYKDAVEDLARKKAVIEGQMRSREDKLPDFTEEPPSVTVVNAAAPTFRRTEWEGRARRLSAVFREFPEIHSSSLGISWTRRLIRYRDTEGRAAMHPRSLWLLEASAETQAEDGMPLRDFVSFYARAPEEAPDEQALAAALREMARSLTAMRSAPALEEPVSGPVLLEDQACAEFFAALVGHSAAVAREPVSEDPHMGAMGGGPSWRGRLNSRVAADFLDAQDDPTRREVRGVRLIGSYDADDEGIPAQAVTLIERGILKGVLSTRIPVKGAARSNGHARSLGFAGIGGSRPAPGVLIVSAANASPVSPQQVRERFLETLRDRGLPAGYVIRRIQNEAANTSRRDETTSMFFGERGPRMSAVPDPIEVYRVSADGAETLVRGFRWADLDPRSLKDLLLASSGEDGESAFNLRSARSGFGGGFGGMPLPMSVVCPRAVLIEEAELGPAGGPFPNPPVMPHPFFAGKPAAGQ